ncbi:MAG TPA: alpha/beta hydrolase-fold protein, partial [Thermoanaerobaculia bacterium]|nr:alpha/beta hydrolase-fold protein [Thermoanaerobaculia bacterium]
MRTIGRVFLLLGFVLSLGAQTTDSPATERFTLTSKIMGEPRTIAVRLPASYRTTERRYPVVYLTDGEGHLGHTAATIEFLSREGRMPEAITVAVANTDRGRDLSPTRVASRPGATGGADRFLDFFEKELIPAIESRYRTASYRVFGGHSLGGLFALHGVFTRPKLFDAWIAVSPAFQWDDRYLFRRAGEFFDKAPKDLATTVVVTIGDEGDDPRKAFEDFRSLVAQRAPKGFDATFVHLADEDHGSVVMPSHYAALRKVFAPWRFALADGADPKQELARATEHFAKLSGRLGYEILPPENLVNLIGYRLLAADRAADAIAVFQTNVKNWPKSANVYDSLGEA